MTLTDKELTDELKRLGADDNASLDEKCSFMRKHLNRLMKLLPKDKESEDKLLVLKAEVSVKTLITAQAEMMRNLLVPEDEFAEIQIARKEIREVLTEVKRREDERFLEEFNRTYDMQVP